MAWKDIDTEVLSEFVEASRSRGHVRSTERQRYLESLPWSLRDDTAALVREEFGPEDPSALSGPAWSDVEEYLWQLCERRRLQGREWARDKYSRLPDRRERLRRTRELKEIKRGVIVGVRCCPVCRAMYAVNALMVDTGGANACSRAHRHYATCVKNGSWKPITIGGERDSLAGWAKRNGVSPQLVRYRTKTLGWSLERALGTPPAPSTKPVDTSIAGRARAAGLDERTVRKRIACGMSVEAALTKHVAPRPQVSVADRARAAGVDPGLVRQRIAKGWRVEDALALPKCAPQECRTAPQRRAKANPSESPNGSNPAIPGTSNHPEIPERSSSRPSAHAARRSAA